MNITEIKNKISQDVETICYQLLTGGKQNGQYFEAGSTSGEAGKSLKVNLRGSHVGLWQDYATGEKGDLIDLWQKVRGVSLPEALTQICEQFRIPQEKPTPRKPIDKPKCKKASEQNQVMEFFAKRGISKSTLEAYKVGATHDTAIFPLFQNGELIMVKYRKLPKEVWCNKEPFPVLFGWQVIDPNARQIVITEGEIDAMSFYEQGIPAVSVPFGGGNKQEKWITNEFANLERFEKIYLCLDNDKAGNEATQEIIDRLGRYRCFVWNSELKDANEMHMKKLSLQALLDNAQTKDPEKLVGVLDCVDDVFQYFFPSPNADQGLRLPWSKTFDKIRFRPAETTLLTGFSGQGKSQMFGQVIVEGISQGYKFAIASMEMPRKTLLGRMIRQASGVDHPTPEFVGECVKWLNENVWIYDVRGKAKTQQVLECFQFCRSRYGVNYFVIDSLSKCGLGEDDYNGQKDFVDQITDFSRDTNSHVFLVAHSKKKEDESKAPAKMDVRGSAALTDLCDNVLSVWRNTPKEDAINSGKAEEKFYSMPDATLKILKQREGEGFIGSFGLWFDRQSLQFKEHETEKVRRYVPFSTLS